MSHSREHAHSHSGAHSHPHKGDATDKTLGKAMWVFATLGTVQVVVALMAGRIALVADGFHNLFEVPTLGTNKWGRIKQAPEYSFMSCRVLPLTPAISSVLAITVASAFVVGGFGSHGLEAVWVAFVLEVMSFAANAWGAKALHSGGDTKLEHDNDRFTAISHLIADMGATGLAVVAYLIMGITQGHTWLDTLATIGGIILITVFHIKPIRRSVHEFRRHRQPEHSCSNGPPRCH